jgi:hypothetical protein
MPTITNGWFSTVSCETTSAAGNYVSGAILDGIIYITKSKPLQYQANIESCGEETPGIVASVIHKIVDNVWGSRFKHEVQVLFSVIYVGMFTLRIFIAARLWFSQPPIRPPQSFIKAQDVFSKFGNSHG